MYFAAYRSDKFAENLFAIESFLKDINIYTCDDKVSKAYGELKSKILSHFGPKEKKKRRRYTLQKAGISENDLWIAAVAIANDMTILSCDSDFKRIQEVQPNLHVTSWIKPKVQISDEKVVSDVQP
ncbi:hypothetical protein BL14DL4_01831 [Bacillus licheniformis]|nr:hypothetical protein BL14DL4_01831 [Bacillus licheniformis]